MTCPHCVTPGILTKVTYPDPRMTLPYLSRIPEHTAPSGARHEESYRLGHRCIRRIWEGDMSIAPTVCGEDLWRPVFWAGGGDQRAWFCVMCSRASALRAYHRRRGSVAVRAARALRKRQTRAEAALRVLRKVVPSLPPTVAQLTRIAELRADCIRRAEE